MKGTKLIAKIFTCIVLLGAMSIATSCSSKKNTAASRNYTAFITKYNIYYNGDTHYKETLSEMEKTYEDDYTTFLYTHPAQAHANEKAPQPSGDFTRSIEKAQKAIQLRSIKKKPKKKSGKKNDAAYKAWMKRDEYNPFLHNAWMMMGRSQFMNGDFLGSASTFFYISKHFTWLPETVTESKLWQARSYCSMDWLYEAEVIITRIKQDDLTNKKLKYLYNVTYADYLIKSGKYEQSVDYLKNAVSFTSGAQKSRLNFLLGQVYTRIGKKAEAYKAYGDAGKWNGATYRTKFNARIKQSEVYEGADITKEVNSLKRMTRYARNKEYLDQIYYAIGNLYLSRCDTTEAIKNYELAAEKSTRNGIDKAISQITLGELYFAKQKYDKAQPCYAEAVPLLPETYPNYKLLKKRSDVLDELAIYSQNVVLQDSLLRLSHLDKEQQLDVIYQIIERLKKKEKEEEENAKRESYLAEKASEGTGLRDNGNSAPTQFTLNTDKAWYFYNTATRNAGKTEFQRKWGGRKLEDDWRRRNKSSFNFNDFEESTTDENADSDSADNSDNTEDSTTVNSPEDEKAAKEKEAHEADPHFPEYYLKQIPATDEDRATSHEIIQEGYFNMGLILKDKLEDYTASMMEFDSLMIKYPENKYKLDVYYNIYLMFMRKNDIRLANRYRNIIVSEFPDSPYGIAMRDPNYIENLKVMEEREEQIYADAYNAYLENKNKDVHAAYEMMQEQYATSKLMPKFMFIDALAYVTENNPDLFKERLKSMLEKYPDTDIAPIASSYLSGLAKGRKLNTGGTNTRGMIWDIRLSNDSTLAENTEAAEFELNPEDKQLFILLFPTDTVSPNELLYKIARHNFTSFVVSDFDLEMMNFGRLGLLIVKGFNNLAELNNYRRVMATSTTLQLPRQVRPVIISVGDFDKLIKEGRSFEEYFNFARQQMYISAEENVLPPEIYGPSEGYDEQNAVTAPEQEETVNSAEQSNTPQQEEMPESTQEPAQSAPQPVQASPAPAKVNTEPAKQPTVEPKAEQTKKEATPQNGNNTKKENKTTTKPDTKKKPEAPKKTTPLPEYPTGSEGDDDPLLN